jgi:hypothetical protein
VVVGGAATLGSKLRSIASSIARLIGMRTMPFSRSIQPYDLSSLALGTGVVGSARLIISIPSSRGSAGSVSPSPLIGVMLRSLSGRSQALNNQ